MTANQALELVKSQVGDEESDYYLYESSSETSSDKCWKFFVDPTPLKGWEHECYLVTVDYDLSNLLLSPSPVVKNLTCPPNGKYTPIDVKSHYGANANDKPLVRKKNSSTSNSSNEYAERTFAVILSGGINQQSNNERYWNDCSFLYQTLVNNYEIPIVISSITNNVTSIVKELSPDENAFNINISTLDSGVYNLTYLIDGEIIDNVKFNKQ
jgi:hypothetical protein